MPALVNTQPGGGKVNHHGVEVARMVSWQGWEPGREYTKNIVLKNVHVKTQKLKYKVPQTRFFHTLYPQPIVLSAGTSFTLPVTFRPLEKVTYSDKIQFTTNTGHFEVPICAVLPQYGIVLPPDIHFNLCAAEDRVTSTFQIRNTSELVTPFMVECEAPFSFDTPEGVLEPHAKMDVTATFKPRAALVYQGQAVVKFGANFDQSRSMKLEGIGKFPHLVVSSTASPPALTPAGLTPAGLTPAGLTPAGLTPAGLTPAGLESLLDFGEVPVSQRVEKWAEVSNLSPVDAPFSVNQLPSGPHIDAVFSCRQQHGVVPAHGSVKIPFVYSPHAVGQTSIGYFHVVAIGNVSKTVIKCVAVSQGPHVRLSHDCVNFMQVNASYRATKTIELINDSNMAATYQFMLDCSGSVFSVSEVSGSLPANSRRSLQLHFEPRHPINYYRKVSILVHNQGGLSVELLGTCHTENQKPSILRDHHVTRYKTHVQRGLSFTPPERLNEMLLEGALSVDEDGCLYNPQESQQAAPAVPDLMEEYFNDDITLTEPHVSLDVDEVDFSQVTDLNYHHHRTVNVTNHTEGKVTVVWTREASHVFSVSPSEVDVLPHKSAIFSITFKPGVLNQFFGAELECFAYYKSLRDFRLVEEATHSPPWCLTLTVTGHTFQPNNETFLPRVKLDSSSLVFPAVNAGESAYRTLLLQNASNTPVMFNFDKDPHGVFSVRPTRGLVTGDHQMFTVRVQPPGVNIYKHTFKLHLNEAHKNTQEVSVWGSAESAAVSLDGDGELFFKPTCVGTASVRQYHVTNVSRIPLRYEWRMTRTDEGLLTVSPAQGVIQPNEKQCHEWTFVPRDQQKVVMKPSLIVWGQGHGTATSAGKKQEFPLRVIGQGSLGVLKCNSAYHDAGTVVVGSSCRQSFVVYNSADCDLHYELSVDQTVTGPYPDDLLQHDPIALSLDDTVGILPARSSKLITAELRPHRRVYYQFSVSYRLLTPQGEVSDSSVTEPHHLCHILVTGVFPTLTVTDARCYGSLNSLSKKQLWRLFSLDSLNTALAADPAPGELIYSMTTRHSHNRRPPVYTRASLHVNFGAAPSDREASVVQLSVENTGSVTSKWSFLMPEDLQLEIECWAETGELDAETLHEMKVMGNKLFTIEPKRGSLEPGESQTISLTYRHEMVGTDRLPVLLKLDQGREILLNFVGVTVASDELYLHVPSHQHVFQPACIGETSSPLQVYELYNGGALPVKYAVDCLPLDLLTQANFDHPVFECLSPRGEVAPGMTASIAWRFTPLEAKTYTVDVPIRIHNGDTTLVTFTGVGYHKHSDVTMTSEADVDVSAQQAVIPVQQAPVSAQQAPVSAQQAPVPGQLCFLSAERVDFADVPLFTNTRRAIMLNNTSSTDHVMYEWHVTSHTDAKLVSMAPSRGSLAPGQATVCKVTFRASGMPSFYDLDVICEITNMREMNKYNEEKAAWAAERERESMEFTITDEERPPSGKLLPLRRTPTPEFSPYMTLPPIRQRSGEDERGDGTRGPADPAGHPAGHPDPAGHPAPPKPFLLHLGVTARTHDVRDYQQDFSPLYHHYFIDRLLSADQTSVDAGDEMNVLDVADVKKPTSVTSCLELEADVIAATLNNILRNLLDDASFHSAIEKLGDERIPYYHQVTTRASPSPAPTPTPAPSILIHTADDSSSLPTPLNTSSQTCTSPSESVVESGRVSPPLIKTRSSERTEQPSDDSLYQRRHLKQMPELGSLIESVMENTLSNIISEAFTPDFNITARPRLVALPPRPRSATADNNNNLNNNITNINTNINITNHA